MKYISVKEILKKDLEKRYDGVNDDLFILNQLSPQKGNVEIPLPMLVSNKQFRLGFTDKIDFDNRFYKEIPEMKNINMDNLFVAGGFVSTILTSVPYNARILDDIDVDIFVYGLDQESATKRVEQFIQDLFNEKKKLKNVDGFMVDVTESKYAISIILDKRKFQIVTRLYETPSEILHSFDMGSSAVGFDGKKVYCTSLGKFALEYKANILDLTRRSTTYESRLKKYFNRGFGIILPELNLDIVRKKYLKYGENEMLIMPHMQAVYTRVTGTKSQYLHVHKLILTRPDFPEHQPTYENWGGWQKKDIIQLNIRKILQNQKSVKLYKVHRQFIKVKDAKTVLDVEPFLTKENIVHHYQDLKKNILKGGKFDFATVEKYITIESIDIIGKILFSLKANDRKKYIDELIDMQIIVTLSNLKKKQNMPKQRIEWSTTDLKLKLSTTAKAWYGPYFKVQNPYIKA